MTQMNGLFDEIKQQRQNDSNRKESSYHSAQLNMGIIA